MFGFHPLIALLMVLIAVVPPVVMGVLVTRYPRFTGKDDPGTRGRDDANEAAPSEVPVNTSPFEFDDEGSKREYRRAHSRPHRGGMILLLGILSVVSCPLMGVLPLSMGTGDLRAMRRGNMDRSGWGMTRVGQLLGAVTAWLCIVIPAMFAFSALFGG